MGPLGSHGCQTLDAPFRQSAPCNINNFCWEPAHMECHFYRWFLICFWCSSFSMPEVPRTQWQDVSSMGYKPSALLHRDDCRRVPHIWYVFRSGVDDEGFICLHTARKETPCERTGYIALDWPIVWRFGMTLGCSPPSCGCIQPLTSPTLNDL